MPFRFKVEQRVTVGDLVRLNPTDSHKLSRVLRHSPGDEIEVLGADENVYRARVEKIEGSGKKIWVRIEGVEPEKRKLNLPSFIVIQAIPKPMKLDWIVEKLTECGVDEIVPLLSTRSFGREHWEARMRRLEKIVGEAVLQCGRRTTPKIHSLTTMADLPSLFKGETSKAVRFLCDENADPVDDHLSKKFFSFSGEFCPERVTLAIGPEGGFSSDENNSFRRMGFQPISLGDLILRVETAAVIALALLRSEITRPK